MGGVYLKPAKGRYKTDCFFVFLSVFLPQDDRWNASAKTVLGRVLTQRIKRRGKKSIML